jgi:hypothetical protein
MDTKTPPLPIVVTVQITSTAPKTTHSIPIPQPKSAPARLQRRPQIVIGYDGPDELYHDQSEELSSISSCDYVIVGSPSD